jgi:predicted ribosomally synthesized peptide with SipW-like signal peptide
MKKILGLAISGLLLIALVAGGTYAYFSDTETSTDNTFTAGTLDLQLTDADETAQDGVTASFTDANIVPGDSVGPSTITLINSGTVAADHADIKFTMVVTDNGTYDAADLGVNIVDMSTVMDVTALSYDGTSLLTQSVAGTFDNSFIEAADVAGNNDDAITLNELKDVIIKNLAGPAASGGTKAFVITIGIDSGVLNGIQGDVVTVTVTFGIFQHSSQNLT